MLLIDQRRFATMRYQRGQFASKTPQHANASEIASGARHLSSTTFQGRAAGSIGGAKASAWVASQMVETGLKAWKRNGFYQNVPIISSSIYKSTISLSQNGKTLSETPSSDVGFLYRTSQEKVCVSHLEIVFVGYGIVAPEYEWNDYRAINMRGKIALVLTGEPGNARADGNQFHAGRLTYYSRWQYKLDEAVRQGAAGVIILHTEKLTGYSFRLVVSEMNRPHRFSSTSQRQHLQFEAWCSEKWARELFLRASLDFDNCVEACDAPGFKAILLGAQLSLRAIAQKSLSHCRNVIGVRPGRVAPREVVLIVAHWDHLGIVASSTGSTTIYPGAVDNAIGVSMLLSLARRICSGAPSRRSICFASTTGEEVGLIGSELFSSHLLATNADVILAINIDGFVPVGRTQDIFLCDGGLTNIRDRFDGIAKQFGRSITVDEEYNSGYFYRSDQVNFAKVGIPSVQLSSGSLRLGENSALGDLLHDKYDREIYHTPLDVFDPRWDFNSLSRDVSLIEGMVRDISNSSWRPNWSASDCFAGASLSLSQ